MTKRKRFKDRVRVYAKENGIKYCVALERFTADVLEARELETDHDPGARCFESLECRLQPVFNSTEELVRWQRHSERIHRSFGELWMKQLRGPRFPLHALPHRDAVEAAFMDVSRIFGSYLSWWRSSTPQLIGDELSPTDRQIYDRALGKIAHHLIVEVGSSWRK